MNRIGLSISNGIQAFSRQTVHNAAGRLSLNRLSIPTRQFSSKGSGRAAKEHIKEATIESESRSIVKESNLENWKKEIVNLSNKEIRSIKENQEANVEAKNWLKKSGFSVEEKEEAISLIKVTPAYTVEVFFSPFPEEEDNAGDVDIGVEDPEHLPSESGSESGSDPDPEAFGNEAAENYRAKPLSYHAELTFNNKEGKPKGRVIIGGEVGGDCRVYINEVQSTTKSKSDSDEKSLPTAVFERLSQDLQDRMYDLCDEVGIDDQMGSFIRHYADNFEETNTIQVLQNIRDICD